MTLVTSIKDRSGATRRLRGGGLSRPSGQEPYGRAAAAAPMPPHPQAGRSRRHAPTVTALARAGPAVLHAPGILSPRKITVKGARCARVAHAMAQAPPLSVIFPGKTSAPIRRTGEVMKN